MLMSILAVQGLVFVFFTLLERLTPRNNYPKPVSFVCLWFCVLIFSSCWIRGYIYFWSDFPSLYQLFVVNDLLTGAVFYLVYSLGNYWIHRVKHSQRFLWRYIHRLHHSTAHMETAIAFYRHPVEIAFNSVYLVVLGKLIFGLSVEAVCVALAIEGCLECFHHSNIQIPKRWQWIGHVIQTPNMHLVHHERKLHRMNYSPFLWDWVFGTLVIPDGNVEKLGFNDRDEVMSYFLLKK